MKPEEAAAKDKELKELVALMAIPAWETVVMDRIRRAQSVHTEGCRSRKLSPTERAEHVEASHLADELAALVPNRIKKLREDLAEFWQKSGNSPYQETPEALR